MKKIYFLLFISVFSFYFSTAQVFQLWGMSLAGGGVDSGGTIFNLNPDGSSFGVVHLFDSLSGFAPNGSLIQAPNGLLFGMTSNGGLNNSGVIFHYDPSGNSYSKDFDFDYNTSGGDAVSTLMLADDQFLYGMTSGGGMHGDGTIFRFDPDHSIFLRLFDFTDSLGRNPYGYLIQATDGKLYGLTSGGGADSAGTLFSFDLSNNKFSVLHNFSHATGDVPNGSLLRVNGKLYGMTAQGGLYGNGVIFSFNLTDSIYTDVYDFNYITGANPYGSLIVGNDSLLYGMTANGGVDSLGNIFSYDPAIDTLYDLYEFATSNGATPEGELLQASNGKFYGTTPFGGADSAGVIFSFDQTNKNYVDLHDFTVADGQLPWGDLVEIMITGIPEKNSLQNIQLYPNPVGNELRVRNEKSGINEIDIYNLLGEKVYGEQLQTGNKNQEITIDVSPLSSGLYFIQATNDNGRWNGKFIKE